MACRLWSHNRQGWSWRSRGRRTFHCWGLSKGGRQSGRCWMGSCRFMVLGSTSKCCRHFACNISKWAIRIPYRFKTKYHIISCIFRNILHILAKIMCLQLQLLHPLFLLLQIPYLLHPNRQALSLRQIRIQLFLGVDQAK